VSGFFVDCHSHVLPSDDDGAQTLDQGLALCDGAARHGTRVLFATPHVWPHLALSLERERAIRRAFAELRKRAPLELRLGFELTPTRALLGEDPRRYALDGTPCVLMEAVFSGPLDLVFALAAHVESNGLRPVIAHPERVDAVLDDPALAGELAARGWPLQVNATSITGFHGPEIQQLALRLLDDGLVSLVASDGHRKARPPQLDAAFSAVSRRLPERATRRLFDGTALGLGAAELAA
jgi:protein-tyrosine phosphatase